MILMSKEIFANPSLQRSFSNLPSIVLAFTFISDSSQIFILCLGVVWKMESTNSVASAVETSGVKWF